MFLKSYAPFSFGLAYILFIACIALYTINSIMTTAVCFMSTEKYLVFLEEVIFPVVSIGGHTIQFCGSGHSRIILPPCLGVGIASGICVVTNMSLRREFLLKPVMSFDSNRCSVCGDLPKSCQLSLSMFCTGLIPS